MTKDEALKLALEALKTIDEAMPFPVAKLAQAAIKEALAQPEQCQCPNCKVTLHASDCAVHSGPAYPAGGCNCGAQPEQEPVAWMDSDGFPWSKQGIECRTTKDTYTPLYTIPPRLKQEHAAHAVIAGALFDFMGWLTSREERIVLSSADEASPAVDAITDFAKVRGLSLDDAKVQDWNTTTPQRTWVGLTDREVELIDGMIEVQMNHAEQCDRIANRTMAEKQKGWDMERVELLRKLKEKNT